MSHALVTGSDRPGGNKRNLRTTRSRCCAALYAASTGVFLCLLVFGWMVLPTLVEISGPAGVASSRFHLFLYLLVREGLLCGVIAWWVRRAAVERRETDVQVEALGQVIGSGVAMVDGDGRVRYANSAFLRLFHTDRDSVLLQRLDRALGLDLTEAQFSGVLPPRGKAHAVLSTIRENEPLEVEIEIVHYQQRDGVQWWVLLAQERRCGLPAAIEDPRRSALPLAA